MTSEDQLSGAARSLNRSSNGALLRQINSCRALKAGEARVLHSLESSGGPVAVVGVGTRGAGVNADEGLDEGRENARRAAAAGAKALRSLGCTDISVDGCGHPDEGASLGLFAYDELKSEAKERLKQPKLSLLSFEDMPHSWSSEWALGSRLGAGQNLARRLMEMPPNLLTPTTFADLAEAQFAGTKAVVTKRDEAWIRSQGMGALLAVSKGSAESPVFLEVSVPGRGDLTAVVGKGVTFDSGGISLKPAASMDEMRADMGGAAVALGAVATAAALPSPPALQLLIPLVENMPGHAATRPGDIVKARSGLSIKVHSVNYVGDVLSTWPHIPIDNTDAEGRLILADALDYACSELKPTRVVDLATLTGAVHVALGNAAAAVFANDDGLWDGLRKAGVQSGDRVWRLPLFSHYGARLKTPYADLNNIAKPGSGGGSCTAAAFLKRFVRPGIAWAHMDIAGVMKADGEVPYIPSGMTGSPTRTLVHWLMAKQ